MISLRTCTIISALTLAAGILSACNSPSPTQVCAKYGEPYPYSGMFRVDCISSTYVCTAPLKLDQTSSGSMFCRMRRENEID